MERMKDVVGVVSILIVKNQTNNNNHSEFQVLMTRCIFVIAPCFSSFQTRF